MAKTTRPTHNWETITPEKAAEYLAKNKVNRPQREEMIRRYARDMKAGSWHTNGDVIRFDTGGNMIDGQHRCLAIVRSGVAQEFLVVRGLPPESQETMDGGGTRSASDVFSFRGEENSPLLVAVTRNIYRVLNGMMGGGSTISTQELLKTLEEHPEARRSTQIAQEGKGKSQIAIAPNTFGIAHWMIAQENGFADADIFLWRLYNCAGEKEGSPVLALMRRVNEIRRQGQRVHHRDYLAMVIKAWNLDAQGKTAIKIATRSRTGSYVLPDVIKRKVPLVEVWDAKTSHEGESPYLDQEAV